MSAATVTAATSRGPRFARVAFVLAVLSIAVLAVSPLGYRLDWLDLRSALLVVPLAGVALAAVALLCSVIAAYITRPATGRRGFALSLAALLLSAVAIGYPVSGAVKSSSVPRIHDITTDTQNPPQFVALAAARRAAPNGAGYGGEEVAAQQRQAYPDIAPLRFALPPDQLFAHVERIAREMGWEVVAAPAAEGRLEATATTPLYGFKDDVVIRITAAGSGSRLDMRSKSRLGVGDLGANAARIRAFVSRLQEAVPATAAQ
ncbi:MAG TPA: DUF1499 domain-containing protein [Burkholderiaceae bacterium]|nr:DUF1499 domain-containing protein [Burkholderiaceae bacterium]